MAKEMMLCTQCGYRGMPKTRVKGSFAVEITLWLLLIVPGIIYTVWRMTSHFKACPSCGGAGMIPVNSPVARKFLNQ